mgnify:CR=1 FL=1
MEKEIYIYEEKFRIILDSYLNGLDKKSFNEYRHRYTLDDKDMNNLKQIGELQIIPIHHKGEKCKEDLFFIGQEGKNDVVSVNKNKFERTIEKTKKDIEEYIASQVQKGKKIYILNDYKKHFQIKKENLEFLWSIFFYLVVE